MSGEEYNSLERRVLVLETKMDAMIEDIKDIKSGISRILWVVGIAIILAFVGFVLKGGLVI